MQYELYLDVLLLTDLGMNLMVLFLTGKLLKLPVRHWKMLVSALIGAVLHAMVLLFMIQTGSRKLLILSPGAAVLMLITAFSIRTGRMLFKAFAVFIGISSMLSGFMQAVNPLQRKTAISFVLAASGGYTGLTILYHFYRSIRRHQGHCYPVRIYIGEEEYHVTGLLDTGNRLIDPFFHKPVHIIEQSVLKNLMPEEQKLHLIPYHSIGKGQGLLKAIIVPRMVVETTDGVHEIKEAVLALSREQIASDKRYQMILHEECMCD